MDERARVALVVAGTVALFLAVQLGALSLAPELQERGYQATEDPQDPANSLAYIGVILVATAGMLVAIKLGAQQVIRAVVLLTSGLLTWYVLGVVLSKALGGVLASGTVGWLALASAVAVPVALLVHPEWYVIDAAGVVMGAGAAGLFGISFGLAPALLLLVGLAVYDAISVYGTEHMLTLAEGVMDLNIPVVLVVPTTRSFTMASIGASEPDDGDDAAAGETGEPLERERGPLERDALFIGLGDAVIPTVLVASAGFFLRAEAPALVPGLALNLPALGAIVGTTVGLLGLLALVLRGRPHAGLPLLNGGAIAGYLAGALAAGVPLVRALGL